eukprot:m.54728 g.54728  ORF g.54728 m.54728 type:complete len:415 (+) comp7553_c0_seq1:233-1477(+)
MPHVKTRGHRHIERGLSLVRRNRNEDVWYNSATAKRSMLGKFCYSVNCPQWYKLTSMRVTHSAWDLAWCCYCICCPKGRKLDTFDSDIITDVSAHQSCFQICLNEGDIVLHRLPGGDPSDPRKDFPVEDIPEVFAVFDAITWELAKLDLRHYVGRTLGRKMGARVWNRGVGGRGLHEPADPLRFPTEDGEVVFYDSLAVKRTFLGGLCHHPCCCPNYYKFTSQRILYTTWDRVPLKLCGLERLCCGRCNVPCGRTLQYFDADLLQDVEAYQRVSQICLNEGDLYLLRLAGADADDKDVRFKITAVPEVYKLFDDLSYDLSRLQLKGFAANAMGNQMQYDSATAPGFNNDPIVDTEPLPSTGGHSDGYRPYRLGETARPPQSESESVALAASLGARPPLARSPTESDPVMSTTAC